MTSSVDPNSTLFKNEVTEKCGTIERVKYANAGCGRYYYYCLGENEGYKYTSAMCEEQTPSESAIKWTGVGLSKNYTNSTYRILSALNCSGNKSFTSCTIIHVSSPAIINSIFLFWRIAVSVMT